METLEYRTYLVEMKSVNGVPQYHFYHKEVKGPEDKRQGYASTWDTATARIDYQIEALRVRRWTHTSMLGQVKRAQISMDTITRLDTTTEQSKLLAHTIRQQLDQLYVSLNTRKD